MYFKKLILLFFSDLSDLIHSNAFLARHKLGLTSFTRSRKLSFPDIVLFLLRLPQKTLSSEIADFVEDCLPQKEIIRISKQAFCVGRQKIAPKAFQELLYFTYRRLHLHPSSTYWHGHVVKAIDGTTFRVPNTPENRRRFQTQKNQYIEVPLIKASILYNVSEDLIEDVVLGKCRDSERNQAEKVLPYKVMHASKGSRPIIIFDRGYQSGALIHYISGNNGLFLMRCPTTSTFKNVLACPLGDSETMIFYKKQKIRLRVLRFILENGEEEVLITNLFDNSLTVKDFEELYIMRWKIEGKYREIKQQLKTENFAGIKPENILQEVYAALAFSNITSALKFLVDKGIEEDTEEKGNRYQYQANRNFLVGSLKKNLHLFLSNTLGTGVVLERLLILAQKERSPIRPGRKEERFWHKYGKSHTYCMNQRTAL